MGAEVFLLPKSKQALTIMMNVDEGRRIYDELPVRHLGAAGKRFVEVEMKSP